MVRPWALNGGSPKRRKKLQQQPRWSETGGRGRSKKEKANLTIRRGNQSRTNSYTFELLVVGMLRFVTGL